MKHVEGKDQTKQGTKKPAKRPVRQESEELKTEPPISEKDEVKKAEQRTQKNIRR